MITTGLFCGGPELFNAAIGKAFRRVATSISDICENKWEGKIPGVHVGFYVDGSAGPYDEVKGISAVRFSRKKKLLLVNVHVPKAVVNDFNKAFHFLLESLHKANSLAAGVFLRKGDEPFDQTKADALVDRVSLYLADPDFRKRIDSKILPGA